MGLCVCVGGWGDDGVVCVVGVVCVCVCVAEVCVCVCGEGLCVCMCV